MKRISPFTPQQILDYNLRDEGTAVSIFADTQSERVRLARSFATDILNRCTRPATIIELGCSAGDISGHFSAEHTVTGVDVVPGAVALARSRYPAMTVIEASVEDLAPQACDLLILTEFLEHVDDPERIVRDWLPLARYVIIGHPIGDPGGIEPGHVWSYSTIDFGRWFEIGGHTHLRVEAFSLGPWPDMLMGSGRRL